MMWRFLSPLAVVFTLIAGATEVFGDELGDFLPFKTKLEQYRLNNEEAEISSLKARLEQLQVNKEAEILSLKN